MENNVKIELEEGVFSFDTAQFKIDESKIKQYMASQSGTYLDLKRWNAKAKNRVDLCEMDLKIVLATESENIRKQYSGEKISEARIESLAKISDSYLEAVGNLQAAMDNYGEINALLESWSKRIDDVHELARQIRAEMKNTDAPNI